MFKPGCMKLRKNLMSYNLCDPAYYNEDVIDIGYDLSRFHKTQEKEYETALSEIRSGKKRSHWMWYIFPQLKGLGYSDMADYYGVSGIDEAKAYLADPLLKGRLVEIASALLGVESDNPREVMGSPDNLKLRSCMTLFAMADPEEEIFRKVLDKFFNGEMDKKTMMMLDTGRT